MFGYCLARASSHNQFCIWHDMCKFVKLLEAIFEGSQYEPATITFRIRFFVHAAKLATEKQMRDLDSHNSKIRALLGTMCSSIKRRDLFNEAKTRLGTIYKPPSLHCEKNSRVHWNSFRTSSSVDMFWMHSWCDQTTWRHIHSLLQNGLQPRRIMKREAFTHATEAHSGMD